MDLRLRLESTQQPPAPSAAAVTIAGPKARSGGIEENRKAKEKTGDFVAFLRLWRLRRLKIALRPACLPRQTAILIGMTMSDAISPVSPTPSSSNSAQVNSPARVLIASLVGTTIEFFDFYVYATA